MDGPHQGHTNKMDSVYLENYFWIYAHTIYDIFLIARNLFLLKLVLRYKNIIPQ